MGIFSREAETAERELDSVRREGRMVLQRNHIASQIIEAALVLHGPSRHPLVDVLLDVRNVLRQR